MCIAQRPTGCGRIKRLVQKRFDGAQDTAAVALPNPGSALWLVLRFRFSRIQLADQMDELRG